MTSHYRLDHVTSASMEGLWEIGNVTQCANCSARHPPPSLTFTDDNLVSVVAYTVLFVISACGNCTVLVSLYRDRSSRAHVKLLLVHLAVADLIVTFVMMPIETVWHITVQWHAGDIMCRVLMLCRPFGLYLSSNVLVCISVDRYMAIVHPLSLNTAEDRTRIMLIIAWTGSLLSSVPQVSE